MSISAPKKPSGYDVTSIPNMTPEQLAMFRERMGQMGQYGGGAYDYLGRLASGDEEAYGALAAPAIRDYQQRIVPGLAERFQGGGMLRSSAFANAAAGEGASLAEKLAAQRAGIQQQSIQSLLGLEQQYMGMDPYQNMLMPKKKKWWETALGVAGDVSSIIGNLIPYANPNPQQGAQQKAPVNPKG